MAAALTNADFRSLLNTSDRLVLEPLDSIKKKKKPSKSLEDDLKREKRKNRYLMIQKKQKSKTQDDEEDDEEYRDRADERRKGNDTFYKKVAEELKEMKERSIEESKYLGGDIEHTHLVKGLDFALLSKIRSELDKVQQEKLAVKISQERQAAKRRRTFESALGRRVYEILCEQLHPHYIQHHDQLRRIEVTILQGAKFKGTTKTFSPGRMCFLFESQLEMSGDDVPTVVFNSKEDCPAAKEGVVTHVHSKLKKEVEEVLRWHSQNRKKKKHERLPRRPGAILAATADANPNITKVANKTNQEDNADIFEGIGKFNAAELSQAEVTANTGLLGGYFGDDETGENKNRLDIIREEEGMELDDDEGRSSVVAVDPNVSVDMYNGTYDGSEALQFPGLYGANSSNSVSYAVSHSNHLKKRVKSGTTTDEQDKGLLSVFKRDETSFKKRGDEDVREKDPSFISSTYIECYPGFGAEVSFQAYDSDDEEDRSKMDMGRQKQYGAKHRHDFDTVQDWEDYQLNKEALPKAAFQYGRKMDDNRVTRRKKKLNPEEEWKQIEKMIGDKKSKGSHSHSHRKESRGSR